MLTITKQISEKIGQKMRREQIRATTPMTHMLFESLLNLFDNQFSIFLSICQFVL